MDPLTRCVESHLLFWKNLFEFIKPIQNSTYRILDSIGIKLLNRLWIDFSHLRGHNPRQFCRHFKSFMCMCPRSWIYQTLFLCCHNYISFQTTLISELCDIGSLLFHTVLMILYRDKRFNPCTNKRILTTTIKYI